MKRLSLLLSLLFSLCFSFSSGIVAPVATVMVVTAAVVASPSIAKAQVAFDAVGSLAVSGGLPASPATYTHTPVGTPTAAIITILNWDGGSNITAVKYGASTLTSPIIAAIDGTHNVYIYCLPNPPSGAQTVSVTYGTIITGFMSIGSVTVTGSDTSTCFRATNTATGTGTAVTVNVTSNTNDLVIDAVGNVNTATFTAGGSQVVRVNNLASGSNTMSSSTLAGGASSTTMSWTQSASNAWAQAAGSIKAATGAAATPQRALLGVGQ